MGPQSAVDREFIYIYLWGGRRVFSLLFSPLCSLLSSHFSLLFSLFSSLFSLLSLLSSLLKKEAPNSKNGFSCRRHAIFFCLWLLVCTRRKKTQIVVPWIFMIFYFLCVVNHVFFE